MCVQVWSADRASLSGLGGTVRYRAASSSVRPKGETFIRLSSPSVFVKLVMVLPVCVCVHICEFVLLIKYSTRPKEQGSTGFTVTKQIGVSLPLDNCCMGDHVSPGNKVSPADAVRSFSFFKQPCGRTRSVVVEKSQYKQEGQWEKIIFKVQKKSLSDHGLQLF